MDITNLSKDGFTDLVDKMLEILHSDERNFNSKINKLINLFCKNPKKINLKIINHSGDTHNDVEKIIPCTETESLLKSKYLLIKDFNFLQNQNDIGGTTIKVYKKYFKNKILKTTKGIDDYEVLFSMLFEYSLYEYAQQPNYLCKVYEIGKYYYNDSGNQRNKNHFYSIMDNCGIDLLIFFEKIKDKMKKNMNNNIFLNNLLIIFYKMIECVKILHDI
jgi:hypothetical protein